MIYKHELRYYSKVISKGLVSWILQLFYLKTNLKFKNDIIVVYSMRKVGSTSIYQSLFKMIPGKLTYHLHDLSDASLNRIKQMNPLNNNIKKGNRVRKLIKNNPDKKLKIVSLVRDPIAVEISYIFHTLRWDKRDANDINYDSLRKELEINNYQYAINWFDEELFSYLGIDVFSFDFDKLKGYTIIRQNNIEILLMTLEGLNDSYKEAFEEYFQIENPKLVHSNKTSNLGYQDLYNEFKKKFILQADKVDQIYNTKFTNHFYTKDQIDLFVKKWTNK